MLNTLKIKDALADLGFHLLERHQQFNLAREIIEAVGSEKLSSYHEGRHDELEYLAGKVAEALESLGEAE